MKQLRHVLASHGFSEPKPGINPDIVLTVLYGRARLANPYASDRLYYEEMAMPGGMARIIAARGEKLFIKISAFKCPTTAHEKPVPLWHTTVNTDDPDEDLNGQSGRMLAAAADYFDRPTRSPQITVSSGLRTGTVTIGTATVVEPAKNGPSH